MRVCVVSDSHDHGDALAAAVRAGVAEGAAAILHCGDLVWAETLRRLPATGVPLHLVHGNNSGDLAELRTLAATRPDIHYHGAEADIRLHGRRIFLSHYPHRAQEAAGRGGWDLCCCGHSHDAVVETVAHPTGETVVVNPGTVAGIGAPPTWAIGDLTTLRFEIRSLG